MSDGSLVCNLNTNPDISGIGVRVSFYLQTFFLVFIVDRKWEDASGALLTTVCTSFGLTIAALAQAVASQLSLYQALQVTHLVHLANISTFLALASYSRKPNSDTPVKFAAVVQAYFSVALTLALWALAPTFGNQAECNDQISIILFSVVPIAKARIPVIVLIAIALVAYTCITWDEFQQWNQRRLKTLRDLKARDEERAQEVEEPEQQPRGEATEEKTVQSRFLAIPPKPHKSGSVSTLSGSIITGDAVSVRTHTHKDPQTKHTKRRRRKRQRWWLQGIDSLLVGIAVMQVFTLVYFVTATELLIQKNESPDTESQVWGFGQILAMVVTLPAACSFIQSFRTPEDRERRTSRFHPPSKGSERR